MDMDELIEHLESLQLVAPVPRVPPNSPIDWVSDDEVNWPMDDIMLPQLNASQPLLTPSDIMMLPSSPFYIQPDEEEIFAELRAIEID